MTNEELRVNQRRAANRLDRLDKEARSVEQKLSNLYSALESGKVDIDDLAPRLKELRVMQIELEDKRAEALEELDGTGDNLIDPLVMDHYVQDLRSVLESASFLECKCFLSTFIRRIDFNKQQVGIEYTVPMPVCDGKNQTTEVLHMRGNGSPSRIRTYDLAVNSRTTEKLLVVLTLLLLQKILFRDRFSIILHQWAMSRRSRATLIPELWGKGIFSDGSVEARGRRSQRRLPTLAWLSCLDHYRRRPHVYGRKGRG